MVEIIDADGVRELWLNRPPANALTPQMLERIRAALEEAAALPRPPAVLLASRLDKYFSAGLELEAVFEGARARLEVFEGLLATHRRLAAYPGPSLAALGGYAMLGGWILAMACDFRWLAEENGRLALSEIRFGLSPTEFLLRRLRAMGADAVLIKELVLRGRTLKAAEAAAGRFVDRLVPAAELNAQARAEAAKLAKLPPAAYASIKRSLADAAGDGADAVWERSWREFSRLFAGEEAAEGLAAMREKRRARWEMSTPQARPAASTPLSYQGSTPFPRGEGGRGDGGEP